MEERFRQRLQREFDDRRKSNSRYSLRAFATLLGADHSTLSQILRSQRPIPLARIRTWSKKLGFEPEVAAAYIAAEQLPDALSAARESQIRHWTAEASAIIMQAIHWQIYCRCQARDFQSDSRWIARQAGTSVDSVNIAFARLLRLGVVHTTQTGRWTCAGDKVKTDREFQRMVLKRIREKAAEFRVKLPASLRIR